MTKSQPNVYSQRWFECFHGDISDARTIPEVEFICTFGPMPKFRTVADVCCGMGRHARSLTRRGYSVTGIDRDPNMIARARSLGGGPRYIEADLRDYQPDTAAYDLIIVMGQSFGHFDAATNQAVLDRLATGLRVRGRLIVDRGIQTFSRHIKESGISICATALLTRKNGFKVAAFLCTSFTRAVNRKISSGSYSLGPR